MEPDGAGNSASALNGNGRLELGVVSALAAPDAALVKPVIHFIKGMRRHGLTWLLDLAVLMGAFSLAFFVRYGGRIPQAYLGRRALEAVLLIAVAYTASDIALHVYRTLWRYAGARDLLRLGVTVALTVASVAVVELTLLRTDRPIPLSALLIGGALGYLALTYVKLLPRLQSLFSRREGKPIIVIGAGAAGNALVSQLNAESGALMPVAFVDDDVRKVGRRIGGLPVAGTRAHIKELVKRYHAEAVVIAIPSAPPETTRNLLDVISEAGARALIVPSLSELMTSRGGMALREIGLEDLFGRSEVGVDLEGIRTTFEGKRVLVTGAAGSIGSEIVRQVAGLDPELIVLVDNNESGLSDLREKLAETTPCVIRMADIGDARRVNEIFAETGPEIVVHAAALKHVDLLEGHTQEALRVNVLGLWTCIAAAETIGSKLFLFISSDKAVDPVSVLGITKRIGECMIASLADSATVFAAVRFGNVIGSRGSVIPRFERQIARGGPLTVTDPEVRRYFMSITEAVSLVLQSATIAQSGHVYVLDMGEEVAIINVARRLAQLRGLRVPKDIQIVFTGLRPGERMREHLVGEDESTYRTEHPKVLAVTGIPRSSRKEWVEVLDKLALARTDETPGVLRRELAHLVERSTGKAAVASPTVLA